MDKDELKKILAGCVKKAGLENAYVEMIQTRGVSPNFVRDPRQASPRHGFCCSFWLDIKTRRF